MFLKLVLSSDDRLTDCWTHFNVYYMVNMTSKSHTQQFFVLLCPCLAGYCHGQCAPRNEYVLALGCKLKLELILISQKLP